MRLSLAALVFAIIWALVWHETTKQPAQHQTPTNKAVKVSELTPEQLGMLDVGLSLNNLHRPMPKWKSARIMKKAKNEVLLANFISKLPPELPKSMKRRRA